MRSIMFGVKTPPASRTGPAAGEGIGDLEEREGHPVLGRRVPLGGDGGPREPRVEIGHAAAVHEGLRDAGQQQMRVRRAVREPELDRAGARRPPVGVGRDDRNPHEGPAVVAAPGDGAGRFLALAEAHERVAAAVAEGHHRRAVRHQPADEPLGLGGEAAVRGGVIKVGVALPRARSGSACRCRRGPCGPSARSCTACRRAAPGCGAPTASARRRRPPPAAACSHSSISCCSHTRESAASASTYPTSAWPYFTVTPICARWTSAVRRRVSPNTNGAVEW